MNCNGNGNGNDGWGDTVVRALVATAVTYAVVWMACVLLFGCSGPRAAVAGSSSVRADTVYRVSVRQDTVRTRDSVWVETYRRGDTVFRDKEVTRWRERLAWRTDTVLRAAVRADTVRVPVTVERRASWWERTVERPLKEVLCVCLIIAIVCGSSVLVRRWLGKR